jgi:hypothetical protein
MTQGKQLLFVNKKKQKNFMTLGQGVWHRRCQTHSSAKRNFYSDAWAEAPALPNAHTRVKKVFCFFFSKKKCFLPFACPA